MTDGTTLENVQNRLEKVEGVFKVLEKLEGAFGAYHTDEVRRLWDKIREERDLEKLFDALKQATRDRKPAHRESIHGMIDTLLSNGDGVQPATPTIILTSSEPCALVVFTAITATICD